MSPELSLHFQSRNPSAIRLAQIEFAKRTDGVEAINTAIGNVSLPMPPALQERMFNLKKDESPVKEGVVQYTSSVGLKETNEAFLNIIASFGFNTEGLYSQVTDGSSQAMELVILGACGPAGSKEKPLFLIDPAYTNYMAMAERTGRATVSVTRFLQENGEFTLPDIEEIEGMIVKHKPGAILVIPYDNPTGQFYDHETMVKLARLCVKYKMWLFSDEAYRGLYYGDKKLSSVWGLTEQEVPGIEGRRVSLESASKVFNACGLRIGAIVTDNRQFHEKSVAEFTTNLCAPMIDQYIFGALAHISHEDLARWYDQQRDYYQPMLASLTEGLRNRLPGIIISKPEASIYSVVDVRKIVKPGFDAVDFVMFCATKGKVELAGRETTLLVSPMVGFYNVERGEENPGKTQMRIAYVETPENMAKVPYLFGELLEQYEGERTR